MPFIRFEPMMWVELTLPKTSTSMAVLMVTGNAAVIPHTILEPLRTIPATIAAELGEAPAGGAHYEALFLLGVVLFFISLLINFTVEAVSARKR